ncbi:hypothetical protein [Thalassotalea marina]|uniref:Uncharacterized protein n=1 Tax=Thalassotalea marina TaxID=1673741 RepID=A0A919BL74_9GAMM|nr:hypothetical protein [Thalassotalea marina]GHF94779.1 hypothetical protein GCM10017161_23820 [Thalassotalea marina]
MNIKQLLESQHQVCLAHVRRIPYTSLKAFIAMTLSALIIAFFIDTAPRYTTHDSQTAVILAATPFVFIPLVLLQSFFQRSVRYNSDVFITRKGVSFPDLTAEKDAFVAYENLKQITVYYLPLTPLFKFGPKIKTHICITDQQNNSNGLHVINMDNVGSLITFLQARGVTIQYRLARWPLVYILMFPVFFSLAWFL